MTHTCPVCGFAQLAEPPYDSAGCASFEICPSCGTEFGYDDAKASHEELRLVGCPLAGVGLVRQRRHRQLGMQENN